MATSAAAGAVFSLGICLPKASAKAMANSATADFIPNAFIEIYANNDIIIKIKYLEMGQGAYTGLSTLIAEELDADWQQLKPEHAPADASKYSQFGPLQMTGGSGGIKAAYQQMRQAGAVAKSMLKQAAANHWQVPIESLTTKNSVISHPASNRTMTYGEIAAQAASLPVPDAKTIVLKTSKEFTHIGKRYLRLDQGKNNGEAIYTQDVKQQNMLVAVVAHPPTFGAKLAAYRDAKSLQIKGVRKILAIPTGVAVVADNFWAAQKARQRLEIQWDNSNAEQASSKSLMNNYKALAEKQGLVAKQEGDATTNLKNSAKTMELDFEFPFLAHATLEPMNCVSLVNKDGCEIWCGTQIQTKAQQSAAKALNISQEKVKINTVFAGGSFGRRASPHSEYLVESVNIAKQLQGIPVKLVWTREDDMHAGYFRPMYFHKVQASLNSKNEINAWHHRVVGKSVLTGSDMFEQFFVQNGIDSSSIDGLTNMPYHITNTQIELHSPENKIPVWSWRSVGHTHTAYAKEVMIDKLAQQANEDPYQFRLKHLPTDSRETTVLKTAAEKANWTKPLPQNWGRGIALHQSFDTHVAQVAEVSTNNDGSFKVERIVCVVDCGLAINPDIIEAQMEGGIGFGLGPILNSEITINNGQVVESNFHDYKVARMSDMPKIEVHIIPSAEYPTGVGEPSTCVIAPAVANALSNITNKVYQKLPIQSI